MADRAQRRRSSDARHLHHGVPAVLRGVGPGRRRGGLSLLRALTLVASLAAAQPPPQLLRLDRDGVPEREVTPDERAILGDPLSPGDAGRQLVVQTEQHPGELTMPIFRSIDRNQPLIKAAKAGDLAA